MRNQTYVNKNQEDIENLILVSILVETFYNLKESEPDNPIYPEALRILRGLEGEAFAIVNAPHSVMDYNNTVALLYASYDYAKRNKIATRVRLSIKKGL